MNHKISIKWWYFFIAVGIFKIFSRRIDFFDRLKWYFPASKINQHQIVSATQFQGYPLFFDECKFLVLVVLIPVLIVTALKIVNLYVNQKSPNH